jgi:uncharacterized membrane protein
MARVKNVLPLDQAPRLEDRQFTQVPFALDREDASRSVVALPEIPSEIAETVRKFGIDTPEKTAASVPGFGAELLALRKREMRHRQKLEEKIMEGEESRQKRAQLYYFIVAIFGIVAAIVASQWSTGAAAAIVIVAVGGPTSGAAVARILDKLSKMN